MAKARIREGMCEACCEEYPVWFTENVLWNNHCLGFAFLCPLCFIKNAEREGCSTTGWKIDTEEGFAAALDAEREPLEKALRKLVGEFQYGDTGAFYPASEGLVAEWWRIAKEALGA